MRRDSKLLQGAALLASIGGVQAGLNLNSSSNIVVYWGQNSLQGTGGQAQQPLAHYCNDNNIDVIPMAFDMMINGPGGAPEIDFSVTSKDCDVFPGTQLKNCPSIAKDIATCQQKGKTILLSIGGATYSEGGFKSNSDAQSGAQLIWETFGPKQEGSKALRPFGDVSLDGFDFDFEANVMHMAAFAQELRSLMDNDTTKQYFLTAAPQCPYPDLSDKDILNGPIYMDAVWVQFYNNFCGVNNFNSDPNTSKYNFDQWDNWAKTVSKNPNVKVLLGVPADTTAASTGYIPADQLATVIDYSKKFASFGGVMMWDATQAEANNGFIQAVRNALGGGGSGSSSSSNSASTAASAPSSTNLPNTSGSSNSLGSPSSSSSSSGSGSSSSGPDHPAPDAHPKSAPNHTGNPSPKPQPETAPTSKPTTASSSKHSAPKPHKPHATNSDSGSDSSKHTKEPVTGVNNTQKGAANNGVAHNLLSTNLFGLLNGLRQANSVPTAITGAIHGITQNLRRVNRFKY